MGGSQVPLRNFFECAITQARHRKSIGNVFAVDSSLLMGDPTGSRRFLGLLKGDTVGLTSKRHRTAIKGFRSYINFTWPSYSTIINTS